MFPLFVFLAIFCVVPAAQAQPLPDLNEIVQDKTFWHGRMPERYYFGADGAFLLQYTSAKEHYSAGSVREGLWRIGESDRLCWAFRDEGIERCYDVAEDLLAKRPWYSFDNVYQLKEVGRPANILWNRWMHGNLITKPDVYEALAEGRSAGLDEKAYIRAITGMIMRLPLNHVYHRADKIAFWVDEKTAEKIAKNPKIVDNDNASSIEADVWRVENGRHCYLTPKSDTVYQSCVTVFSAQDLYVPQEGWVQIMDDNFIRLIKTADLVPVQ